MASTSTLRSSLRSERQVSQGPSKSVTGKAQSTAPRAKLPASTSGRSVTPNSRLHSDSEPGRVRVAVRLRPRNPEDLLLDADFADCVELRPELKRLTLRRNNWSSESYKFDEIFSEGASQRRVYEVVAKPVVEGVLNGYNGTVMAYGQTGTGKTYTVGNLGRADASERGITIRALEDIVSSTSAHDSIEVSYLQLYMESLQDLLSPEKTNIPIVEDPRTGEVSLPGATVVKVQEFDHFLQLLQIGEANRHVSNTKLNTSSSRSHAILMVHVQRSIHGRVDSKIISQETRRRELLGGKGVPTVQKSKLLIVDLAGSERLDKSGNEGHLLDEAKFINLSLTSLGKCINALAESSAHIPIRDSKLTRLLRDSFGGSARTSLIVTIGPSARHHAETASTIMFGQRAMKIENVLKIREEFDYESLCHKLESQVDQLTIELDRQQKLQENDKQEMEKKLRECQCSLAEAEKNLLIRSEVLEKENAHWESQMKNILIELNHERENNNLTTDEIAHLKMSLKQSEIQRQKEFDELTMKLQDKYKMDESALNELPLLKSENKDILSENAKMKEKLHVMTQKLLFEEKQRMMAENELLSLQKLATDTDYEHKKENMGTECCSRSPLGLHESNLSREAMFGQRATISKICEEVGLQNIIALLTSEDLDVQIQAVKVVANLAAEDINQEKIVGEGGLDALLVLLRSSQNITILRVSSGAIANLAMNALNQGLIMIKGGAQLLANTATKTDDPQTLRMVAGAIANLCGNEKLHSKLKEDGGIKALLRMVGSGNCDVIAQVARGMANFAKCESRGIIQGHRKGRSLLMEDGVLAWLISNPTASSSSTRRHIELALCHLAQNEGNTGDFISSGGVRELVRISVESSREDIRDLAKKALKSNPAFLTDIDPK